MGFDWKAFGAAFLDKQTEGIRKRRADAEEYEEEQEVEDDDKNSS